MSYCRWSSDNWRCDLYCYEDVNGGITTHVACKSVSIDEWTKAHKKQMEFLHTAKSEKIGLSYDGETFNDPDYESFLKRLLHLREVGYNFPDWVIEEVEEDIKRQEGRGEDRRSYKNPRPPL